MKILVTGATGFIGRYVVETLLARGHDMVATATSAEKAGQESWYSRVTFVPHVIGAELPGEPLFQKFHCPDVLVHLAWTGLPNYGKLFHFEEVLPKQYFFLKTLIEGGLKDLTVTGTCFEYGKREGALTEDMCPLPANPYAIAKNCLRLFLESLQRHFPYHLKWVRLFYMYGSGQSPNSILSQLDKALTAGDAVFNMSPGDQLRDYLPVEDMADLIADIATQQVVEGCINGCSGRPIAVTDLVEQHLQRHGATIALNKGFYSIPEYEAKNFWGDTEKLSRIIAARE